MRIVEKALKLDKKWVGIAAGTIAAICYGAMYYVVHAEAGRLPATQITFSRCLITMLVTTPGALMASKRLFSREALSIWIRSIASVFTVVCLAWNLQHTSIGFANVLYNLAPMVVLVLGILTGAIPRGIRQAVCMFLVVIGSCLCWYGSSVTPSLLVWVVGLTGATAAGIAYTMLERQTAGWSAAALLWPLNLLSLPLMLLLKSGPWPSLSAQNAVPLLGVGVLCVSAQYLVVTSFRYAGLAIATALVPSAIGFGIIVEIIATRQVHPTALVGCFIYLSGLTPLMVLNSKRKKIRASDGLAESSSALGLKHTHEIERA